MPFARLLISFAAGIIIQWYLRVAVAFWFTLLAVSLLLFILFFFLPLVARYRLATSIGSVVVLLFLCCGAITTFKNDIRNNDHWIGRIPAAHTCYQVTLDENGVEKASSCKAIASLDAVIINNQKQKAAGKIILYFSKDPLSKQLTEGTVIFFNRPLQEIKSAGNPGGFDYNRYCLFQHITHQVYLAPRDYAVSTDAPVAFLSAFINAIRKKTLSIIRTYIPGEKEKGLAEALLIGYKDDLDKTLVQSYSNTGVVHIIAISGLHLGLIYWLLVQLLKPLQRKKYTSWLRPVIIIAALWIFSILAGAQPSVLRSAVMFTCIILGECLRRRSSIYNSLAASAFVLLCYNPFWLWDVGFQLSYAAVLSIVIFMKPVYNRLYIKNKMLDFIWKMSAVTIAAQVLTAPLGIFHFHQFPVYFLLTNLVAVPVSSLIVLGEILLCAVYFIHPVAMVVGRLLYFLTWCMDTWVERMEGLPFSLWDGLQINILQTLLLLVAICFLSYWLFQKQKSGLIAALVLLSGFVSLRTLSFMQAQQQEKIIVYNIPRIKAIDIIRGRNYLYIGDASLRAESLTHNSYLKPARTLYRLKDQDTGGDIGSGLFLYHNLHILMLDSAIRFVKPSNKPFVDLLILSGNPTLHIPQLAGCFDVKQVVFDASVPIWKCRYWKKDFDSLNIPNYDVKEKGAFVMNLR